MSDPSLHLTGRQREQLDRVGEPALAALRTRYCNASMADMTGGDGQTAVRWWIKFNMLGKGRSPIMRVDQWTSLADKLRNEMVMMDFWL